MGCPVPVHCRQCGDALDVYEPPESRFCSEECESAFIEADHAQNHRSASQKRPQNFG